MFANVLRTGQDYPIIRVGNILQSSNQFLANSVNSGFNPGRDIELNKNTADIFFYGLFTDSWFVIPFTTACKTSRSRKDNSPRSESPSSIHEETRAAIRRLSQPFCPWATPLTASKITSGASSFIR